MRGRGVVGGKGWLILASPSPRHRAPPPPYLYANELHFAILMFQPSRPGLARKGAQDTRKRVRPGPYMFTTVPSRQPIPSVRNYGWMGDRRVRLTKRVDATTKEISPLFPLIDLLLSLFFFFLFVFDRSV